MNKINNGISLWQALTVSFICSLLAVPAWAAEVTYDVDSYTSGDTLTADDLNVKFNDIKAGVNDNNSNVVINTTNIDINKTGIDDLSLKLNANTAGAGATTGDMQYWNGTAWVLVPATTKSRVSNLTFCRGVPTWESCPYEIGDTGPAGGIVFYITDGGAHGLEAAPADQSAAVWGCHLTDITGAAGSAVGTGPLNTAEIVANCADAGTAAKVSVAYSLNGYDDWFLPSLYELNALYLQQIIVGGFASDNYWTSSQRDITSAYYQAFDGGYQGSSHKLSALGVRAVRAF